MTLPLPLPRSTSEPDGLVREAVLRVRQGESTPDEDFLAVEEPLEIRLEHGPESDRQITRLSVTLRTPGADTELVAGFLFTEGIISGATDIRNFDFPAQSGCVRQPGSVIVASLQPDLAISLESQERHSVTSAACGACGKTSLEALRAAAPMSGIPDCLRIPATCIHSLPARLRQQQTNFSRTGGLHACARFSPAGELISLREDIGRHNALDKLIGEGFLSGSLRPGEEILLVSGRAGFELIQKAAVAGFTVFAAVGAPSSLALDLAREYGMTLLGFVREDRFNIYHGAWRICEAGHPIGQPE